jgi:hypothetical protein
MPFENLLRPARLEKRNLKLSSNFTGRRSAGWPPSGEVVEAGELGSQSKVPKGHHQMTGREWTDQDVQVLKNLHPDFRAIERALPHRTLAAIHKRAQQLKLRAKQPVWAEWEDELVRTHAPDYQLLAELLPHRTYRAIGSRAELLDVTSLKRWTKPALQKLYKLLWEGCPFDEIVQCFPGRSRKALDDMAMKMGMRRGRKFRVTSKVRLASDIRERCANEGVSLTTIYRAVRGDGFLCERRIKQDGLNYRATSEAVELLGGELYAEWED